MAFNIETYNRYNTRIFVASDLVGGVLVTGAISDIVTVNLPGSKVLISSPGGKVVSSGTPSSKLVYLDNVTSDIQTQVDGKQNIFTAGNLTESTSSVLTITGGTGALVSAATIRVLQAATAQSGYLSSTDWNTFNTKRSSALADGYTWIGDGAGASQPRVPSGDWTWTNLGVSTIANSAITNAKVSATAAIARTKLAPLSASIVPVTDASGFLVDSAVTSTVLNYISTLSANAQTQITARLPVTLTSVAQGDVIYYNGSAWVNLPRGTSGYVLKSTGSSIAWSAGTANGQPTGGTAGQYLRKTSGTDYDSAFASILLSEISGVTSSANDINILTGAAAFGITPTEFQTLNGVSSNIQSQIDAKQPASLTYSHIWVGNISNIPTQLAPGSNSTILTMSGGAVVWQSAPSGGHVIQNSTTALTQRANLNFTSGLTVTDNAGTNASDVVLGGTLLAVTTITSNLANGLIFNGAWATIANASHLSISPTITNTSGNSVINGLLINPTFITTAGSPTFYPLRVQSGGADAFSVKTTSTVNTVTINSGLTPTLSFTGDNTFITNQYSAQFNIGSGPRYFDFSTGATAFGPGSIVRFYGDTGNVLIATTTDDTVNKLQVNGRGIFNGSFSTTANYSHLSVSPTITNTSGNSVINGVLINPTFVTTAGSPTFYPLRVQSGGVDIMSVRNTGEAVVFARGNPVFDDFEIQRTVADVNGATISNYMNTALIPNDRLGEFHYYGNDASLSKVQYMAFGAEMVINATGAHSGRFIMNLFSGGVNKEFLRVQPSATATYLDMQLGLQSDDKGAVHFGATGKWMFGQQLGSPTGWFRFTGNDVSSVAAGITNQNNTTSFTSFYIGKSVSMLAADGLTFYDFADSYGTFDGFRAAGTAIRAGSNMSGGLSIVSEHATTGDIRFYTGGSTTAKQNVTITSTGNVLIGTTTDDTISKLQVLGNIGILQNGADATSAITQKSSFAQHFKTSLWDTSGTPAEKKGWFSFRANASASVSLGQDLTLYTSTGASPGYGSPILRITNDANPILTVGPSVRHGFREDPGVGIRIGAFTGGGGYDIKLVENNDVNVIAKFIITSGSYINTADLTIGGTTVTNASTLLDLQSTTKAFKLATATTGSIVTPATGMLTSDTGVPNFYTGSAWGSILLGGVTQTVPSGTIFTGDLRVSGTLQAGTNLYIGDNTHGRTYFSGNTWYFNNIANGGIIFQVNGTDGWAIQGTSNHFIAVTDNNNDIGTSTGGRPRNVYVAGNIVIANPARTFNYTFTGGAIAAARTITLPLLTGNDVMVTADFIQTLTNKTLTSSTNVLGGVTMTLGSDASYDMYHRGTGVLTRIANGTTGQVLTATTGAAPAWGAVPGGISGLTANRIPYATSATALGDNANFTWDNTNKSVTISNSRFFEITKSSVNDLFIGQGAGNFTTTGIGGNLGIGKNVLSAQTSPQANTVIGHLSGTSITTAGNNTIVGFSSGTTLDAGGSTLIGSGVGNNITSGYAIVIGYGINAPSATASGQLNIQNIIYGTGNTQTSGSLPISTGFIGIGEPAPARRFHVSLDDATTNSVAYLQRLTKTTSGTPGNGLGVGIEWEVETAANTNEIIAYTEASKVSGTSTSLISQFDIITHNDPAGFTAGTTLRIGNTTNVSARIADNLVSSVVYALNLRHEVAGTINPGSGIGINFEQETSTAFSVGATIEAVSTNVTTATAAFDLVFKMMNAGAAATEKFRMVSTGDFKVNGSSGTSGQFLTSAGVGASPTWTTSGTVSGLTNNRVTISAGATSLKDFGGLTYTDGSVPVLSLGYDTGTGRGSLVLRGNQSTNARTAEIEFYHSGNLVAEIVSNRAGEVNSGDLVFYTYNTGAATLAGYISKAGNWAIGKGATLTPSNSLQVWLTDAATTAIGAPQRLTHATTATPAAGIGTALEFETQTTTGPAYSVGSTIASVSTNVGVGTEAFDLVFKTMTGGAAANEKLRILANGNLGFNGSSFGGGVLAMFLANATTVPTSNPTGGGILYAEAGALKYRGSSGSITTLAVA